MNNKQSWLVLFFIWVAYVAAAFFVFGYGLVEATITKEAEVRAEIKDSGIVARTTANDVIGNILSCV